MQKYRSALFLLSVFIIFFGWRLAALLDLQRQFNDTERAYQVAQEYRYLALAGFGHTGILPSGGAMADGHPKVGVAARTVEHGNASIDPLPSTIPGGQYVNFSWSGPAEVAIAAFVQKFTGHQAGQYTSFQASLEKDTTPSISLQAKIFVPKEEYSSEFMSIISDFGALQVNYKEDEQERILKNFTGRLIGVVFVGGVFQALVCKDDCQASTVHRLLIGDVIDGWRVTEISARGLSIANETGSDSEEFRHIELLER